MSARLHWRELTASAAVCALGVAALGGGPVGTCFGAILGFFFELREQRSENTF